MSEPWGIVVVPTEAGRVLTEPGACRSLPPQVHRGAAPWEEWCSCSDRSSGLLEGLPLRWGGLPIPEGVFRAWQMWDPDASPEAEAAFEATGWTTYDVLGESLESASAAEWLARALEAAGLCRVVLLDLVDGAVVERAP